MNDPAPARTLAQRIRATERAYDKALRHPRGDGLDRAGADLARLYAQQREQTTSSATSPTYGRTA